MGKLIETVQERFDKIVIDTPPVLPVTDAAVAAAYAEAVVVIVRHGHTSRTLVANAATTLENVDARVVGSVLNMKKSSRVERRRYGHHGYYFSKGGTPTTQLTSRPVQTSTAQTTVVEPEAKPEGNSQPKPEGNSQPKPEGNSQPKPEGNSQAKPETNGWVLPGTPSEDSVTIPTKK